jgi:uncharacterized protein (TIGR03085 family)
MASTNFARTERSALADLLVEIGPDQPTLCEGWQTRDLAAHIVVRDRRPDAAAGIIVKKFAPRTDRIRNAAAVRPWDRLIDQLRQPPRLSMAGFPPLDRAANTSEFFIHHEDVRRAQSGWSPRPLPEALGKTFYGQVKLMAKLRLRKFPAKIIINIPGYGEPLIVGVGGEVLDVSGDPGELTLFLSGRQESAHVTLVGPDALVDKLRHAKLGL